ncbi:hypothetical protein C1645_820020 [Glomus cerebriforme]|uniref:Uncharacterized protein n=1 Tax=Glomus cerebriforme TaxID=658196 RepID=A0A397T3R2_9GLOM|nr:hypothetical protein C1645_820020 [Glomus cerebriforme]
MTNNIKQIEDVGRISIDVFLYAGFNTVRDLKEKVSYTQCIQEHITEFEAENINLRKKILEFDTERAEFKCRIFEALKMTEEERTKHGTKNAKLKAIIKKLKFENVEFRDKFIKVE